MHYPGPAHGEPPHEFLKSVDLALVLILMLRDTGKLTIKEAADSLQVAPSTVHRSLSMLVYRGFAIRGANRDYVAGPALSSSSLEPGAGSRLVQLSRTHLEAIARQSGETAQLMILTGNKCNVVASSEVQGPERVSTRRGQIIPAHQNAGGLAMLSELSASELRGLYPAMPDADFDDLRRTLFRSRERGFAINYGLYEANVSAVGCSLINDLGDVLGAITISVPTHRFRLVYQRCADVLTANVRDLNRTLVTADKSDLS